MIVLVVYLFRIYIMRKKNVFSNDNTGGRNG